MSLCHHCLRQWIATSSASTPYCSDFTNTSILFTVRINHHTVCAGVVGTAIRHSTSCAGRRVAACGCVGRHNEWCAGLQYQPLQRRPYKWSISILPRSRFYKKQRKLAFSTSCTAVRPHRRLRNDAWRRPTVSDVTIGMWRHNQQVTNHEHNGKPWFSLPK